MLDLFSGSESLRKPVKDLGHEYFSVENDCSFSPDLCADILTLDSNDIPFSPDIIWASPPCTYFSVASIGKHWHKDHAPKTEQAIYGMSLVSKALRLIGELNPIWYYIENPRGKLRKLSLMSEMPFRRTVTYCQYGIQE